MRLRRSAAIILVLLGVLSAASPVLAQPRRNEPAAAAAPAPSTATPQTAEETRRDLEELRNDQSRTAGCDFLLALARYRVVIPSVALVRTRSTLSRNAGSLSPDC